MRILIHSNAPWVATGYGVQVKLLLPQLQALGHEVAVSAYHGHAGGIISVGGVRIYPRGRRDTDFGMDVVEAHCHHFGADVLLSLVDAWVMDPGRLEGVRWAPWFPVDREPLPAPVYEVVRQAWQPLVFSQFGLQQVEAAGLCADYIPLAVDTRVFTPIDRQTARQELGWPESAFIVGMVGANKGTPSRKALPQAVEAFARFHRQHPDSWLYLHTTDGQAGEFEGADLHHLVEHLGIADAVEFGDEYQLHLGASDQRMALIYSAIDVLLEPSMGEGFGVPLLEAQACGTSVITGGWTAMPELCFAGWTLDRETESEPFWTNQAAYFRLPHIRAITEKLTTAYAALGHRDIRARHALRARTGALAYDVQQVAAQFWQPALERMAERVALTDRVAAETGS